MHQASTSSPPPIQDIGFACALPWASLVLLRNFSSRPGVSPVLVLLPLRQKHGVCRLFKIITQIAVHVLQEQSSAVVACTCPVIQIIGGWEGPRSYEHQVIAISCYGFARLWFFLTLPVCR